MGKREDERAVLTATFELYGWEPMSAMTTRGPGRETLICDARGCIIRRNKQGVVIFAGKKDTKRARPYRELRQWSDITLPLLRGMHARLLRLIAARAQSTQPTGELNVLD